ncbi:hypothetical protein D4768_21235 [Rhodococcus erythropolis]|uniref:serine/threonine protein kinase n=1 Tax=Rhodococcus erythropolis TaxID=1833 RepID=UPI001F454779|nr:protein kinase [Rhodococcus erythropolis]UJC79921.1 hypothetical protein D4768_21235 [Rhodococcus erythropolis]
MDLPTLLTEVSDRLGLEDAKPLTQGGQKMVLTGRLGGIDAVAKVVFTPAGPAGQIALKRAHREVELLSAVDSDYVVRVLTDAIEIGEQPDAVCWAENRLDGVDISVLLANKWDHDDVWALLYDISCALEACHELEVVHRDLSPGNVRKTSNGRYILMDPGLARHLAKTAMTGNFQPGTPGFRSPEHVPNGDPATASDIFALGLLAFYALSGRFAIDPNVSDAEYNRLLLESQAEDIRVLEPDVPSDLAEIVNRCLERQPARRFIDGTELHEAIADVRGNK